jgi:hypothetical protein
MLDITSTLLLAMATNRTLWIEWGQQLGNLSSGIEDYRMSDFNALFNSSLHQAERRPPDGMIMNASSSSMINGNECFLHEVLTSPDLGSAMLLSTDVQVYTHTKHDWWGGLLLKNKHYKNSFFRNLSFTSGFPVLFRALFNPRIPSGPPAQCEWLIQYRVKLATPKWRVHPIDRFIECAVSNGMTFRDYKTTWIVTDDEDHLLENASPLSRRILTQMHLPSEKLGCRGPCGDRQAVEAMYKMSGCKRAVLTFGSSFGSCITGLAGMQPHNQFRVGRYGECHRLPSDEPYDMNTVSRYGNTATYMSQIRE